MAGLYTPLYPSNRWNRRCSIDGWCYLLTCTLLATLNESEICWFSFVYSLVWFECWRYQKLLLYWMRLSLVNIASHTCYERHSHMKLQLLFESIFSLFTFLLLIFMCRYSSFSSFFFFRIWLAPVDLSKHIVWHILLPLFLYLFWFSSRFPPLRQIGLIERLVMIVAVWWWWCLELKTLELEHFVNFIGVSQIFHLPLKCIALIECYV